MPDYIMLKGRIQQSKIIQFCEESICLQFFTTLKNCVKGAT